MNLRRRKTDAGVNILCLGIPRAQPLDLLAGSLLKMFPLYICHIAHSNPTNHILREYWQVRNFVVKLQIFLQFTVLSFWGSREQII